MMLDSWCQWVWNRMVGSSSDSKERRQNKRCAVEKSHTSEGPRPRGMGVIGFRNYQSRVVELLLVHLLRQRREKVESHKQAPKTKYNNPQAVGPVRSVRLIVAHHYTFSPQLRSPCSLINRVYLFYRNASRNED